MTARISSSPGASTPTASARSWACGWPCVTMAGRRCVTECGNCSDKVEFGRDAGPLTFDKHEMTATRIERDPLGEKAVPADALYGIQTLRAAENFPISGLRPLPQFVDAVVWIK